MLSTKPVRIAAAVTAIAVAITVPVALSAPKGTLSASSPKYEWSGGPLIGVAVAGQTDDTPIDVQQDGTVTFIFKPGGDSDPIGDIDMSLYKGTDTSGTPIATSANSGTDEKITKALTAGTYTVEAIAFTGTGATYKGSATLEGATATPTTTTGETPPPPAADAPPVAKISTPAKAASKSTTLKRFTGKARDDKGVTRVEIALVQKKGAKCSALTATGSLKSGPCTPATWLKATGTTSWSFKLKKPLKKGSYSLYARAVDSANQTQATPATKSFKVS